LHETPIPNSVDKAWCSALVRWMGVCKTANWHLLGYRFRETETTERGSHHGDLRFEYGSDG